jgi:hypothetical protein
MGSGLKIDFQLPQKLLITMSNNRAKKRVARPHKPLSKALLLPMDRASARELSLAHHLALAACRRDGGNKHLINELARAVYMAYFLQLAGFGSLTVSTFHDAERALESALARAAKIDDWKLADDETSLFEVILALHDDQLARAPMHRVVDAEKRLRAFVMGSAPSPLADLK